MGIVLFAWLFVVGAQATPFVRPTSYDLPIPYPEDVRVRLTSAQEVWILGERISVQLDVQNRGSTPVPYSSDSPSHLRHPPALGRNTRVAVTAVDGEGHVAADPYPYNISAETETWTRLKPGETYSETLALQTLAAVDRPGTWTITVHPNLGWNDSPPLKTTIEVRSPTPEQAQALFHTELALPERHQWPYNLANPDFRRFQDEIYLSMLVAMCRRGDPRGVDGIAAQRNPAATATLLALVREGVLPAEIRAALLDRLPRPDYSIWVLHWHWRTADMSAAAWTAPVIEDAMSWAWRLLRSGDPAEIAAGARIVHSLGQPGDLPLFMEIMDTTLLHLAHDPFALNNPTPEGREEAQWELMGAARQLLERGATPPRNAETPGQALVLLHRLEGLSDADFRFLFAFDGPMQRHLLYLSEDRLGDFIPELADLASRVDPKDARTVWGRVERGGPEVVFEVALRYLGDAENPDALEDAARRALESGGGDVVRVYRFLAAQLDNPVFTARAFQLLAEMVEGGAPAVRTRVNWKGVRDGSLPGRWQAFIEANADGIRAGEIRVGRSPLVGDLIPSGYNYFVYEDGSSWPRYHILPR